MLVKIIVSVFTYLIVCVCDRLVDQVVKASVSRVEDLWKESHLQWDFSVSSHTIYLEIGTPVATLPGAWRERVRTWSGQYTVTEWGRKFDLQLLSQCGST